MIVQIYEVQNSKEAKNLAKLGVDHIGVLVGFGKFKRELSPQKAKKIFENLNKNTKQWKTYTN